MPFAARSAFLAQHDKTGKADIHRSLDAFRAEGIDPCRACGTGAVKTISVWIFEQVCNTDHAGWVEM
jgi:hypothetical protein